MTLGEFLHPLSRGSQKDLLLACMYYLHRYEAKETVTTADIKAAFSRAKNAKGVKIKYAAVLNQAVPFVHAPAGKVDGERLAWALTDTGSKRVRELLSLPAAEAELEHDVGTLQKLAATLSDEGVRSYVDEGIVCLRAGALRAATVFLWTGAVMTLRERVWATGMPTIDAALKLHKPKTRDFKKQEDFAYVKDGDLLQIAHDLGVLDKSEKTLLGQALDLRNQCGHPVKYNPGVKKVAAFVEDVVGIVWKRSAA
jgi:hypothetical protein